MSGPIGFFAGEPFHETERRGRGEQASAIVEKEVGIHLFGQLVFRPTNGLGQFRSHQVVFRHVFFTELPPRFPVQNVYVGNGKRIYAGRVESGNVCVGSRVVFSLRERRP